MLDVVLVKSLLHWMLHSPTHQRDEDIIRTLTSVDFCWLQRITKRRFKRRIRKQLKGTYIPSSIPSYTQGYHSFAPNKGKHVFPCPINTMKTTFLVSLFFNSLIPHCLKSISFRSSCYYLLCFFQTLLFHGYVTFWRRRFGATGLAHGRFGAWRFGRYCISLRKLV